MATKKKAKRKYLLYLEKSIDALLSGIDRANSVHDVYGQEGSLLLISNAWELLSKAILLRDHVSILYSDGRSISAEDALSKIVDKKYLTGNQAQHIQQVISLRNAAAHSVLPRIPDEILFHLEFYSVKFFKDLVSSEFPNYSKKCNGNFLSLSFDTFTTYADKVQKLVARARKRGTPEQELMWLLERGIRFHGGKYISQDKFEAEVKSIGKKRKLYPQLRVADFIKESQMVVIVPVQAPKGYTADINLRKGVSKAGAALPVMIKKTDIDVDYPFLTADIGRQLGKGTNFVAAAMKKLKIKGDPLYHQSVRTSKSGGINRYTQRAADLIKAELRKNSSFDPYH